MSGNTRVSRFRDIARLVTLFVVVAVGAAYLSRLSQEELDGTAQVIDGDSLRVAGIEVRLEGIDAPEFGQICTDVDGQDYGCGERSRQELRRLIANGPVLCQSAQRDRYGRALSFCFAENDAISLNEHMVRNGWAVDFGGFGSVEREARRRGVGLWAGTFDMPRDFRARRGDAGGFPWLLSIFGGDRG
ncbi:MAG: thermonuclease family protein [Pseudomonadota bacterium]